MHFKHTFSLFLLSCLQFDKPENPGNLTTWLLLWTCRCQSINFILGFTFIITCIYLYISKSIPFQQPVSSLGLNLSHFFNWQPYTILPFVVSRFHLWFWILLSVWTLQLYTYIYIYKYISNFSCWYAKASKMATQDNASNCNITEHFPPKNCITLSLTNLKMWLMNWSWLDTL